MPELFTAFSKDTSGAVGLDWAALAGVFIFLSMGAVVTAVLQAVAVAGSGFAALHALALVRQLPSLTAEGLLSDLDNARYALRV